MQGRKVVLPLVAVANVEGSIFVELQMVVIVTFAIILIGAVKINIGGAIRVNRYVFDAVRVDTVIVTDFATTLQHGFELSFDAPVLTSVREIPYFRHNKIPPEKN